ncbi:unnamed protein product [Oreochromis niloticus]|nr:unnamed protein product [Mustela putorius furo]
MRVDEVKSGEQKEQKEVRQASRDTAQVRHEKGGLFQGFTAGKLVKAFSRNKLNEEEQEMTRGGESEREEQMEHDDKGSVGQHGGVESSEGERSKEKEDRDTRREKINFLKVLQIDRLKKSISKGDKRDSDREMGSSVESLNEIGKEGKRGGKVSVMGSRVKGSSKTDVEDEQKPEVKEEDRNEEFKKRSSEEARGTAEEKKTGTQAERTGKTESVADKLPVMRLLESHQLTTGFSRGRSKEKEQSSGSGESDGGRGRNPEEESQEESGFVKQINWRNHKTRKGRKLTRGRKIREGREKNKTRGENTKTSDIDDDTGGGGGHEKGGLRPGITKD